MNASQVVTAVCNRMLAKGAPVIAGIPAPRARYFSVRVVYKLLHNSRAGDLHPPIELGVLSVIRRGNRVSIDSLAHYHGKDRGRKVVVGLLAGDVVAVRPAGTRREPLTVKASDLYDYLVRCVANREALAKAREKKERKAQRLADARQARAEKRLTRPL